MSVCFSCVLDFVFSCRSKRAAPLVQVQRRCHAVGAAGAQKMARRDRAEPVETDFSKTDFSLSDRLWPKLRF